MAVESHGRDIESIGYRTHGQSTQAICVRQGQGGAQDVAAVDNGRPSHEVSISYIHMRVLLSDGSGLTARQCATRLSNSGHVVEVLAPDPLCLCRFTRHVARVNRVRRYGTDPFGWLEDALRIYEARGFDVLLPTQEQVAVLSFAQDRLDQAHVATVVPPFSALAAVQDKISAAATLERLGIPQPPFATDLEDWHRFPAFVKEPIGTASGGVRQVTSPEELRLAASGWSGLVQAAVDGPLVMCQSVFDHGALVAFHSNERTGEGASGGASHKRSISLPEVRHFFEVLAADLDWHGALSADVILGSDGPVLIDINPRLVEPQNAWLAGVDLVGRMMELATGSHPKRQIEGRPGVATHQLLLAVVGAAQHGRGRQGIVDEVVRASRHSGTYRNSTEELTPIVGDARALVPLVTATAALMVAPRTWSWFSTGSVSSYALTDNAWRQIFGAHRRGVHPALSTSSTTQGTRHIRPPSRTAELMAVQRGLESSHRPDERLFEDPYAKSFVSPAWRIALFVSQLAIVRKVIEAAYDLVAGPGPRASAIARTRLIDDLFDELIPTVGQVVILGAGYDTRPYRLACLSGRRVFEVDHRSTQEKKRSVTGLAEEGRSSGVTYVPVDFEADDLVDSLFEAGFTTDEPSLFLWEGVTQYLSEDAIDTTFAALRRCTKAKDILVFTYVDRAVISGESAEFPEAARWLRGVSRRGEPWLFGIAPREASEFLKARGFDLRSDLSTNQAGNRYFIPRGRRDRGSHLYHIALAQRLGD
jgi:methyltransferase (TIGR00027 family)